ncbi:type II toxin-antitoxin system HicB family antitoxin [Terriglobus sp. ADX1]|uniref:type II toxin-antitoxin system HicB family antitoxin n=1 Tax=Terriglobus sp. ADX1 TaxID=2794063 RepID=UPI003FCD116C
MVSEVHLKIAGYNAVFEQAVDGSWRGTVPDLPAILTSGPTLDEVKANMQEAIGLWLENAKRS